MKRKLRGRRPAFENGTSDGSQRHFDLEQLGDKLTQAVPLHGADEGPARGIERFDHRALPPRLRDDAHDARLVAQQRTDWGARSFRVNPRSFDFHISIYTYPANSRAAINHGVPATFATVPAQEAGTADHPKAAHLLVDDFPQRSSAGASATGGRRARHP